MIMAASCQGTLGDFPRKACIWPMQVRLRCLRPVLPAEAATLDLDRLSVGQVKDCP
jgi:hypothetical protein